MDQPNLNHSDIDPENNIDTDSFINHESGNQSNQTQLLEAIITKIWECDDCGNENNLSDDPDFCNACNYFNPDDAAKLAYQMSKHAGIRKSRSSKVPINPDTLKI